MQNFPSVVCGRVVDPNPGDKILDMCAAPGGKTTHLASIVQAKLNQGSGSGDSTKIIACDKSQNKIDQVWFYFVVLGNYCEVKLDSRSIYESKPIIGNFFIGTDYFLPGWGGLGLI